MLSFIFKNNKLRILLTYVLLLVEFGLFAIVPYLLGLCVDSLMQQKMGDFYLYLATVLCGFIIGFTRRRFDNRVYMRIWASISTNLIGNLIDKDVDPKTVVSRSPLVMRYAEFFEYIIPAAVGSVMDIFVSIAMIWWFVPKIAWLVTLLSFFSIAFSYWLSTQVKKVEQRSQEILEEVNTAILGSDKEKIFNGHQLLRRNYVRESDLDAFGWGTGDVLGIISEVIVIFSLIGGGMSCGTILSNIMYVNRLFGRAGFASVFFARLKQVEVCDEFLTKGV